MDVKPQREEQRTNHKGMREEDRPENKEEGDAGVSAGPSLPKKRSSQHQVLVRLGADFWVLVSLCAFDGLGAQAPQFIRRLYSEAFLLSSESRYCEPRSLFCQCSRFLL